MICNLGPVSRTLSSGMPQQYDALSATYDFLDPGGWTLNGGSPIAQRKFRELAGDAAAKRTLASTGGKSESWQLWLDFMYREGWRGPEVASASSTAPKRLPFSVFKRMDERSSSTLPRVFQTSADCCRDLEEREQRDDPATSGAS